MVVQPDPHNLFPAFAFFMPMSTRARARTVPFITVFTKIAGYFFA
jgi:hypothetical protein